MSHSLKSAANASSAARIATLLRDGLVTHLYHRWSPCFVVRFHTIIKRPNSVMVLGLYCMKFKERLPSHGCDGKTSIHAHARYKLIKGDYPVVEFIVHDYDTSPLLGLEY